VSIAVVPEGRRACRIGNARQPCRVRSGTGVRVIFGVASRRPGRQPVQAIVAVSHRRAVGPRFLSRATEYIDCVCRRPRVGAADLRDKAKAVCRVGRLGAA
jgi:hypothetical protein